eukprot:jgi/Botrbrau1/11092/Bobra.0219s0003.1
MMEDPIDVDGVYYTLRLHLQREKIIPSHLRPKVHPNGNLCERTVMQSLRSESEAPMTTNLMRGCGVRCLCIGQQCNER